MENQELRTLKNRINELLKTINSDKTQDIQKVVLSRSLIEQYSIFNLLKEDPDLIEDRINLFKAYEYLKVFLQNIAIDMETRSVSAGFPVQHPGLCEDAHIQTLIGSLKEANEKFAGKVNLYIKVSLNLSANVTNDDYYSFSKKLLHKSDNHFPFPYKEISGVEIKSITELIEKYSRFNKNEIKIRYNILADLSHGTLLTASNVYMKVAKPIVDKISQGINN